MPRLFLALPPGVDRDANVEIEETSMLLYDSRGVSYRAESYLVRES